MKLHCDREALLQDCQLVSVATSNRDVKPILRNIKAIAADGRCCLMATDLELGIRLDVRAPDVVKPGEAMWPAARLIAILRESYDDRLTIEADADRCSVTGERLEYEMPNEDPADFPDLPTFSDEKCHVLTAGLLRKMIRRTVFAAAKESTRYAMTGVLWELEGGQCRMVATDSKRLAVVVGDGEQHGGHDTSGGQHLVPTKAMALLERNLHDDAELVKVSMRPNEVLFRTERAVVYSRLVEGRYPPYRDILPKKATCRVPLSVEPFMAAVRQAAIMTDDQSKRVVFQFRPGLLTLKAQGPATGRSKVELPLEAFDGPEIDMAFDPQFVIELLKVLDADSPLVLEMTTPDKPVVFRAGPEYQYLVMPLT